MSQDKGKISKWVVPSFSDISTNNSAAKPTKKRRQEGGHQVNSQSTSAVPKSDSSAPWVEKYFPKSVGELAVHKKKVESVYDWLQLVSIGNQGAKFGLLKGPTGSGKSTTVKVAAKALGLDLKEWITPSNFNYYMEDLDGIKKFENYRSDKELIREFVIRGSRFPSLFSQTATKSLILIEDWPASLLRDPTPWHEILEEFSQVGKCPIVMVTGEEQAFNKLIPENIIRQHKIEVFMFNPLAPTLLKKILTDIAMQETPSSFSTKEVVESICQSSCGDLRSAINTLQFACLRGFSKGAADAVKGKIQKSPEKKRQKLNPSKTQESAELAKIGGRDAPDDFFYTISKALYAKRQEDGQLKTSPDDIVEKVTDRSDMFTGFVQENYLDFMPDIQTAAKCAENLELASRILHNSFDKPSLITVGLNVVARGVMSTKRDKNRASFFKSHRKPKYIQVESNFRELNLNARRSFPYSNSSSNALLTELLPYTALIQPHGLDYAQISVINKMPLNGAEIWLRPSVPSNGSSQNGAECDPELNIDEIDSD